jgi:ABC-type branched-subunit amino acid transport system substrate-binding protein
MRSRATCTLVVACVLYASLAAAASNESRYDPGASATEIKIGQTMPYSGPVTAAATIGRAEAAYFKMVNEHGGINGRTINFLTLDDGYNPARTVEQTRKLVEHEQVLLIFGSLGTANNSVIQKYLNAKQIPHLLIAAIGLRWNDPKNFPWSIAFTASPLVEMEAFYRHLARIRPNAKIAVLYQNDDFGKDYLKATKEVLGDKASKIIVAEASYEVTDPSVDSQIIALQTSGADTLLAFTTPKFGAFSIRKAYDIGWNPIRFVALPSSSVATVLTPAGLDKSVGLLAAQYAKDPLDPAWKDDAEMLAYVSWMKRYNPEGDVTDTFNIIGYISASLMVEILKRCGDDLTRANVMRQATNLQDVRVPMLLPGINVTTSPSDYRPIKQTQLRRFDGRRWAKVED